MSRVEAIRGTLLRAFPASEVEVIDESHLHVGHAGAADGRGHFRVRLRSPELSASPLLSAHRAVHAALAELLRTDIHALSIQILPGTRPGSPLDEEDR